MTLEEPMSATLAVVLLLSVLPVRAVAAAGGELEPATTPGRACPGSSRASSAPAFPARDFSVTDFGAVGDGVDRRDRRAARRRSRRATPPAEGAWSCRRASS